MYLVGSRSLGLENEDSDWDYIDFSDDVKENENFTNKHLEPKKHCYFFNRKYFNSCIRYNIYDSDDLTYLNNIAYYLSGASDINPLSLRDKWIRKLKNINVDCRHRLPLRNKNGYTKHFYILVYNLECIKTNSLRPTGESLLRVRRFHDMCADPKEYEMVLEEIQNLQ